MADTGSIRIVKEFTYRGATRRFSNRYAIGTNVPPDDAHWTAFADAVVLAEKAIYRAFASGGAKIVEAVGYAPGSEIPVFVKVYTTDGTLTATGMQSVPGDCAAVVKFTTPDRSVKNHPVYCFSYFHGMGAATGAATSDLLHANQISALQTYANLWISGISDGTTTFHRSRPTGNLCLTATVNPSITHRDLAH